MSEQIPIIGVSSLNPNDGFVMFRNSNGTLVQATKAQIQDFLNGDITFDDLTLTGTLTVGGFSTFTGAVVMSSTLTQSVQTLAATGTNQGTAALIVLDFVNVTGADGTKGVILPTISTGRTIVISNTDNTNTLKLYPPTGGKINRGTANAAIILQPNATFTIAGDMEATTDWSTIGYTSYGTGSVVADAVTINAKEGIITVPVASGHIVANTAYSFTLTNSNILTTSGYVWGLRFKATSSSLGAIVTTSTQSAGTVVVNIYNADPILELDADIELTYRIINK